MSNRNKILYHLLYPIHITVWVGLLLYYIYNPFSWIDILYFIIGWILIYGIGVHAVLHRLVSHKSYTPRPWLTPFLLWLACLNLQGSPLWWAAIHRGSHHRYTDTDKDAHSPVNGKWHAAHSWLYQWKKYFHLKSARDLLRNPLHRWISKNYNLIIIVSYIVIGLISWKFLLFAVMLPAVVGLYQESNINVQCHTPCVGYRNFETNNDSRNISVLAWTSWGQGWHNNHHYQGRSYDFGTTISGNPKEFDLSLLFLPFIATKESRQLIYSERKLAILRHADKF